MRKTKINKLNIYVTDDPIEGYNDLELIETMEMCHDLAHGKRKSSSLRKLQRAIKKYPKVPQFWNYLSGYYDQHGRRDKALELNDKIIKRFPNYFFGRINQIKLLLHAEDIDFDRIDQLLGESKSLAEFMPNQEVFHSSAFFEYYHTVSIFEAKQGNRDAAEDALDTILEYFDESNPRVRHLAREIAYHSYLYVFKPFKYEKEVESFSTYELPQTVDPPKLNHEVLRNLYCNTNDVSSDLIDEIMALPKDTVIEDLLAIMYDSVRRFEYYSDRGSDLLFEEDEKWIGDFSVNAMYFLSVLGNDSHLDDILNILRQGGEFLDFWFSDYINSLISPCIFHLGKHQTDKLKMFLLEPNVYSIARSLVMGTVQQFAFNDSSRNEEILTWNKDFLQQLLEIGEEEGIIDTDFYSFAIADMVDSRRTELLPLIKKMYDNNWIDPKNIGSYEDIVKEINLPFDPADRHPMPKDIYEFFTRKYHERQERSNRDWSTSEEIPNSRAARLVQNAVVGALSKIGED